MEDNKNIIVIEWAKNIPGAIPKECLEVTFEYLDETTREITFKASGEVYHELIKGLK
jgi:tRNA A37 threonylcarbamoyladenosine biosynthesis protein TsaE